MIKEDDNTHGSEVINKAIRIDTTNVTYLAQGLPGKRLIPCSSGKSIATIST